MRTPPDLPVSLIDDCLRQGYGLVVAGSTFLPLGADTEAALFKVGTADGSTFLLKLRSGGRNPVGAEVPAFLHHERRISAVLAPLRTLTGEPSLRHQGFDWMLFPFIEGSSGFEQALTPRQWSELGSALRAVHDTSLPPQLLALIPRDNRSSQWRDSVRRCQRLIQGGDPGWDAITRQFISLWTQHQPGIDRLLATSEALAVLLASKSLPLVPCHGDLHGGNLLLGEDGGLSILDWDSLVLAPRERDLMFIGAGVGGVWNRPEETEHFYHGYGPSPVSTEAICYYRHERILVDLVEFCALVFAEGGREKERRLALDWMAQQFTGGNVVEQAEACLDAEWVADRA